jgi:hypothetical protein
MSRENKIRSKALRDQRLAHEALVGRPRSKSWGGRPSAKQQRSAWKKEVE